MHKSSPDLFDKPSEVQIMKRKEGKTNKGQRFQLPKDSWLMHTYHLL